MNPKSSEIFEEYAHRFWREHGTSREDMGTSLEMAEQLTAVGDYDSAREIYTRVGMSGDRIYKGLAHAGLAKTIVKMALLAPTDKDRLLNYADHARLALEEAMAQVVYINRIAPEVAYKPRSSANK